MKPLKVLLVDDSSLQLEFQQALLRDQHFVFITAQDGTEALASAREHQPDIILMDVEMPQMNGIEAARQLRADPATAHIPIVMVSAQADIEIMEDAFVCGCSDYVTKPMHKADVVSKILSLTGTRIQALGDD